MTTVGEGFPKEQARCRELLRQYHSIGPAGGFGASFIENALRDADAAMASGDPVAVLKAFAAMRDCK